MYCKSRFYKRIDLQGNMKVAEMMASIPLDTLTDEYHRLRDYFDKNELLNEMKNVLNGQKNKTLLNNAFIELSALVNTFCNTYLREYQPEVSIGITYKLHLDELQAEIQKLNPNYASVCCSYQNLITNIGVLVESRKQKIQSKLITLKTNDVYTETEHRACVIC